MRQKNTKIFLAAALLAVAVMTAVPARAAEQYRAEVGKDSLLQKAVAWLVDGWFVESVDSPSGFVKAKKYENSNTLLSVTTAVRTEVSVIIRPAGDTASTFVVQAYVTTEALKKILAKEGLSDDTGLCRRIADGIRAQK